MKITIFGGGGFIGSSVADRLLRDRHELRIFERPHVAPYRAFAPGERVEWISGDFHDVRDVSGAVEGSDAVVHLASSTLPKNSNDDPVLDVQANLVPTLRLLEVLAAQKIAKLVFISSGGTVYGVHESLPIDERHPTEPLVSYGIVKLAIEKHLGLSARLHGLKPVILRVANPYGERQRVEAAQGAVAVFLHRALRGLPVEVWGDGSVVRDFIHVSDVAEAFARAVEYSGPKSVFNIGSGVGTSLSDLISMLEKTLGKSIARRALPARPFDVPVSVLSNDLARQELKWKPSISMRKGLELTAAWMKAELARSSSPRS
ncbi:MAG: NAD-dependent epimerase/dehydratase family protein [Elusimicrobiota bacterium]